eukprot:s2213_g9.t1
MIVSIFQDISTILSLVKTISCTASMAEEELSTASPAKAPPVSPLQQISSAAEKARAELLRCENPSAAITSTVEWLRSTSDAAKILLSDKGKEEESLIRAKVDAQRMQEQWIQLLEGPTGQRPLCEKEL